jgi:hypothetical protein
MYLVSKRLLLKRQPQMHYPAPNNEQLSTTLTGPVTQSVNTVKFSMNSANTDCKLGV